MTNRFEDRADGAPEAAVRLTYLSRSEAETESFAAALAAKLFPGSLVALRGDLGSGKTCFVRGLATGLGIRPERVHSPSFTLINEYRGGKMPLYHIDLYRLGAGDMDTLALREYLDGDGLCAVEWFERLDETPPGLALQFTFVGETERRLVAVARGRRYDEILLALAADLGRSVESDGKD